MARPKNNDYPTYMTDDGDLGGFVVRNPITGLKRRFGRDEEDAARSAANALLEWVDNERKADALEKGRPRIGAAVDRWMQDKLPFIPWDEGTRANHVSRLKKFQRECGDRLIARTDCLFLEDYIRSFFTTTDTFNDWRYILVVFWRYLVSKKLAEVNEPEKIEPMSTSKKLDMNLKVRRPLDIGGFTTIHAKGPGFLQIAMEQSLITLQARNEICHMQYAHYRDGFLYVIREKTSAESDMAFIRIEITEELEDIRRRSLLTVDGPPSYVCVQALELQRQGLPTAEIADRLESTRKKISQLLWYAKKRAQVPMVPTISPYLVHRVPLRRRRDQLETKAHWTCVEPDYLTRAFATARDATGLWDHLDSEERPPFHEIRGLGARIYEDLGVPKKRIQALMTHSDKKTTEVYLSGGAAALNDDDYLRVSAPLTLREMLACKS